MVQYTENCTREIGMTRLNQGHARKLNKKSCNVFNVTISRYLAGENWSGGGRTSRATNGVSEATTECDHG